MQQSQNPYKGAATLLAVFLNVLFFLLVGVFLGKLFRVTPAGISYLRPTDVTPWVLLPIFAGSALFLGTGVVSQFLSRKTADVYVAPVLVLKALQFLVSCAIVLFIVNALSCALPHVFGLTVC